MTLQDLHKQINPDSTCKIIETLDLFKINFNSNKNKFLSLAYRCRNDVAILDKFNANGVSIFSFKKHAFVDKLFTLILVYKTIHADFLRCYSIQQYSIDIIAGDLSYDLLKVSGNRLLDIFTDMV